MVTNSHARARSAIACANIGQSCKVAGSKSAPLIFVGASAKCQRPTLLDQSYKWRHGPSSKRESIVDLNKDEKAQLVALIQKSRPGARKIKRANILLLANSGKPDFEIAELLLTNWLAVLQTRHRFMEIHGG